MSIQAIAWVLEHEHTTSGADRLVLLSLANHAGERDGEWECYPSVARIGREAGIARSRTVQECLARLVEAGLVSRRINAAPDERIPGNRRPTLYRLLRTTTNSDGRSGPVDSPVDETHDDQLGVTDTDIPNDPELSPGVTDTAGRGDAFRPAGVTDTDTQTVSQPSINPLPHACATRAVVEVCGLGEGGSTKTGDRALRRAVDELVEAGADEDEIRARAAVYRSKWPEAVLTPGALVRHWSHLRPATRIVRTVVVRCEPCGQTMPSDGICRLDPALDGCPSVLAFTWAHDVDTG